VNPGQLGALPSRIGSARRAELVVEVRELNEDAARTLFPRGRTRGGRGDRAQTCSTEHWMLIRLWKARRLRRTSACPVLNHDGLILPRAGGRGWRTVPPERVSAFRKYQGVPRSVCGSTSNVRVQAPCGAEGLGECVAAMLRGFQRGEGGRPTRAGEHCGTEKVEALCAGAVDYCNDLGC